MLMPSSPSRRASSNAPRIIMSVSIDPRGRRRRLVDVLIHLMPSGKHVDDNRHLRAVVDGAVAHLTSGVSMQAGVTRATLVRSGSAGS